MVAFPLQTERRTGEFVAGLGGCDRMFTRHVRLFPDIHRFTDSIVIDVDADQRPAILPEHRLKMQHPSHGSIGLEVIEPPLAAGRSDESTLMRAIDIRGPLFENDLFLIRAVDRLRPENGLPSFADAAFGYTDIIIAVELEDLGAFRGGTGIDRHAGIQQGSAVGTHLVYDYGASARSAVPQVSLPVTVMFVPERTGIFPFRSGADLDQRRPGACGIGGGTHEQSFIRGAEIDIEPMVVIAESGRP